MFRCWYSDFSPFSLRLNCSNRHSHLVVCGLYSISPTFPQVARFLFWPCFCSVSPLFSVFLAGSPGCDVSSSSVGVFLCIVVFCTMARFCRRCFCSASISVFSFPGCVFSVAVSGVCLCFFFTCDVSRSHASFSAVPVFRISFFSWGFFVVR